MQFYLTQRAFHQRTNRWATTLDDLKLADMPGLPEHTTKITPVPKGYEAAITFSPPGGKPETWTIRQDSRIQLAPSASRR
jgi:hypothetical protein